MKKEEIRDMLNEMEIETTSKMSKKVLEEMLEEASVVAAGEETEGACEAFGSFDPTDEVDCGVCPAKVACESATEKTAEEKAVKKEKKVTKKAGPRSGVVRSVKSKYDTFEDLAADIKAVEAGSMCIGFDKLLLEGGTMAEFLALSKAISEEKGTGFRNEKSILVHFRDRGRQNGWVIDEMEGDKFQVVGVNNDARRPRTDSKKYAEWKAARDAEKAIEDAEKTAIEAEKAALEPEVVKEPVAEEEAVEETEQQMDMVVNQ